MATHDDVLTPPDRRALWRWVAQSSRPFLGWILLALGALAIFLGWFGVSGQSLPAKQLPYLISGGLTGLALIVVGAVLLATDNVRRHVGRLQGMERKVDDLYALLVLEPPAEAPPAEQARTAPPSTAVEQPPGPTRYVALPSGSTYHLPTCALVAGKAGAAAVAADAIEARHLQPCPVCQPAPTAKS